MPIKTIDFELAPSGSITLGQRYALGAGEIPVSIVPAVVTTMMATKNTLDLLRLVMLDQMELDEERVNIYNQKFKIPDDDALFIVLQYRFNKIISSRNYTDFINSEYMEFQDLNTQENIAIGIFSRSLEAFTRKEEVVMGLLSFFAQQLQEQYSFKIARIAPILDLSELEASALLYRYEIPVTVLRAYSKVKVIDSNDYYTRFPIDVIVNDGQPDMSLTFDQPTTIGEVI